MIRLSYALQIENLRSAIRYLRNENSLLKSKDLYRELHLMPALSPYRPSTPPVPDLIEPSSTADHSPASPSSSSSSSAGDSDVLRTPGPTRHSLETESKLLFQQVVAGLRSKNRIVDVSDLGAGSSAWKSRRKRPEVQIWEMKREERRLEQSVDDLKERLRRLQRGAA